MKCPGCNAAFTMPTYQCVNGHSVCEKCNFKLLNCPTCTGVYLGTRNYKLEAILARVQYSCPNVEIGCLDTFTKNELKVHEKKCTYRNYTCYTSTCAWSGGRIMLEAHIKKFHPGDYLTISKFTVIYDSETICSRVIYISAYGEMFVANEKVKDGVLYWFARYIGIPENASTFDYTIELHADPDTNKDLKISKICCNDNMTDDEIIYNGLCVSAMLNKSIQTYKTKDGKYKWTISITRNKDIISF